MAILNFNGYIVKEMNYTRNPKFKPNKKNRINLTPTFDVQNNIENNKIIVNLHVKAGSLDDEFIPFEVSCSIQGTFEYNDEEDVNNIGVDSFVHNNSVAILYPYARAIIATLTTTSNEFPGYNMPTVNIAEVLKNK
ncbi:protein-export chaperone SecB [Companilactobacillus nantensis]|uniref:protein-export chaperone SecB n=1 Tax=Companilactobacillus nantensis TaxID=305793 RepID=UPI00070EF6AC|nr:protein-export chaperone SecB [Companilactobacillus nantensis]GEO64928.1 hypothetical protein LNA01_21110 [Companilactobacillus nantensis]